MTNFPWLSSKCGYVICQGSAAGTLYSHISAHTIWEWKEVLSPAEIGPSRRFIIKTGMWAFQIIVIKIAVDSCPRFSWTFIYLWINILIFDCSPQPLYEDVVVGSSTMLHTAPGTSVQKDTDVLWTGKVFVHKMDTKEE